MSRYAGVTILTSSRGRQYYQDVKYPDIPISSNDIYVITDFLDRVDLIANDYYNDSSLYWILKIANPDSLPTDSIYIPEGTQIRIPADPQSVIQAFNDLNGIS